MANISFKTIQFPGLSNVYTVPQIDNTNTIAGKAADAKKTGDDISQLKADLDNLDGLSEDVKIALLNIANSVMFTSNNGAQLISALTQAFYKDSSLSRIEVTFSPGTTTFYDGDNINLLKPYITVVGYFADGSTRTIDDYALLGFLKSPSSTITVSCGGKTANFNVQVTSTVLFILENHEANGTPSTVVDSGVKLLDSDRSFTIAVDVALESSLDTALSGARWSLLQCIATSSPWDGFEAISVSPSKNAQMPLSMQWMGGWLSDGSEFTSFDKSTTGRVRCVFTHEVDSGTVTGYVKSGNNEVQTTTISKAFTAKTRSSLKFFGNASGSQKFAGFANKVVVDGRVWSTDEINAFVS